MSNRENENKIFYELPMQEHDYFDKGSTKIVQKIVLIVIAAYLYNELSPFIPSCSMNKNGWKIYPFEKKFFSSSMLFMTSAVIMIVEIDVWPYNTIPQNKLITFVGETNTWLSTQNVYQRSIPVCMESVRSTKFHCILLGVILLLYVLDKHGKTDMRRIRNLF